MKKLSWLKVGQHQFQKNVTHRLTLVLVDGRDNECVFSCLIGVFLLAVTSSIVRRTTVPARTGASMLAGGILFPASITVTMAAGIDGFALGLPASAAIITVSIAGAGRGLLALQYPCMAAAFRASARSIRAGAVALCCVCS